MTTEDGRAAVLDGRHHLELAKADMPGIGFAPGGAMAVEDVCDLQPLAAHGRRLNSGSRSPFGRRASRSSGLVTVRDRGVGDTGVTGGGVEFGVAEQHLDDADVGILFQEMGGEAVPQGMRRHPLLDPGGLGGTARLS